MDSAPLDDLLDDWLQAPEYSENWDRGQKEAQVVSSAKNHWIRELDGVWPMRAQGRVQKSWGLEIEGVAFHA